MKKFNTLKIMCATNPDWNGTWYRSYIKNDMHELGIHSDLGEWPYIFVHVFDVLDRPVKELNLEMLANLFETGVVKDIKFTIDGNEVHIWQC